MRKAIVLLSGGIDSTTALYIAKKRYQCHCLIFDYGQRHKKEINSAKRIAQRIKCRYKIIKFKLPWGGSTLLMKTAPLTKSTKHKAQSTKQIPPTYVPARNTIFLSFALSFAETIGAEAIFIGANQIDFSGYPDCRPQYYQVFQEVIKKGTKTGVEGKKIKIITPLINKTKAQIILLGKKLKAPFELTWSCYKGERKPCGECDSCLFRAKGFKEAGLRDPLLMTNNK